MERMWNELEMRRNRSVGGRWVFEFNSLIYVNIKLQILMC